jgi:ATP/maltotriose-dependent transcriptional regulator MalT
MVRLFLLLLFRNSLADLSSRYLMESGASEECMDLMTIATELCEDKESIEYAHLCNTAGCAEYERGHVKEAYSFMKESRRIKEVRLP